MKIKVVSFNIRSCDDKDGNSIPERAPRLSAVVLQTDADVIGIQEYTPAWEEHIEREFCGEYQLFNKYRTLSGWVESAPILWKKDKFECIKCGYFWLSDTPEVESRGWDTLPHNRICTYVILRDKQSGCAFNFMNTHFGFGEECHVNSARLICDYAQKLSELPTFITGDFNLTPDTVGYAEMTKYFVDVNAQTARDMRNTFHGYAPEKYPDSHIDFCFVDKSINPITQRIMTETVDGKYPSDHYGIYSEIEI